MEKMAALGFVTQFLGKSLEHESEELSSSSWSSLPFLFKLFPSSCCSSIFKIIARVCRSLTSNLNSSVIFPSFV